MDFISQLLGLKKGPFFLTLLLFSARGILVFLSALIIIRLAPKRMFSGASQFDNLLVILLAASFGAAINPETPFLGMLLAIILIVVLHWMFNIASYRYRSFSELLKGHTQVLLSDDKLNQDLMKKHHITIEDLASEIRKSKDIKDIRQIKQVILEKNGHISVIKKD